MHCCTLDVGQLFSAMLLGKAVCAHCRARWAAWVALHPESLGARYFPL